MSLAQSWRLKSQGFGKTSKTPVLSSSCILSTVSTRQGSISFVRQNPRQMVSCACLAKQAPSFQVQSHTSSLVFRVSFVAFRVSFIHSSVFLLIESRKRIKNLGLRFPRDNPL
jgi:hypothetical protein